MGYTFIENANPKSTYQKQLIDNQRELNTNHDDAFMRRELQIKEAIKFKKSED